MGDTITLMNMIRITDANDQTIGCLTFFPVHGTSMSKSNHLVSGDNKGLAEFLLEKEMNGSPYMPSRAKFVSAFVQA
jgi:neutral ceramidase